MVRSRIADVAHTWYRAPQNLPPGVNKGGLEVTAGYRPDPDTGTHSYACHACVVRVDTETGAVVLEDYLVVEDGGKLVNPMIVDGQVLGGLAQGIGTALYEEMPYDDDRPAAGRRRWRTICCPARPTCPTCGSTTWRRSAPGPPSARRASARAARSARRRAIINAINDALAPLGAEVLDLPASPPRVLAAIAAARAERK